jgi:Domain of unknown function (DUF4440)
MFPLLALVGALVAGPALQADPVEVIRIWNVTWDDVVDRNGNRTKVPLLSWGPLDAPTLHVRYSPPLQVSVVLSLDDRFRLAKLSNDPGMLANILSDEFVETTQNGNTRNKTEMIDLFRSFKIVSLETTRATIRAGDNAVTITGEQTEINASGTDRMLFTRVYVREASDGWKLLASAQSRKP